MEDDGIFSLDNATDDPMARVDGECMIVGEKLFESMESQVFVIWSFFKQFKNSFREILYMVRKEFVLGLEMRCIIDFPIHG
jgi:hypothetical protein